MLRSPRLLACMALEIVLPGLLAAQGEIFPLADVRPGQRGYAETVFQGETRERFEFEVIDVMKNFIPKRNVIIARLVGDKVEYTGVVAGMSGSPAYIDGRLVGALAYSFGLFTKEPIAGITPIGEMIEIRRRERNRSQELPGYLSSGSAEIDFVPAMLGLAPLDWEALPARAHAQPVGELQSIGTPLLFGGISNAVVEHFAPHFQRLGMETVLGGTSLLAQSGAASKRLVGGDAVAMVLVNGDMTIGATGTVTFVDGDQVFAFGHPVFGMGIADLPMAGVHILLTLPSLMASNKMATIGEVIGAFRQDRSSGALGILGATAPTLDVSITRTLVGGGSEDYHFQVHKDHALRTLTPYFFQMALLNALYSSQMGGGEPGMRVKADFALQGHAPVSVENVFALAGRPAFFSPNEVQFMATSEVASTLGSFVLSGFETPDVTSVRVQFAPLGDIREATVAEVAVNKPVVLPGDEVSLFIELRPHRGALVRLVQTIKLPENLKARRVTIAVGGATDMIRRDVRNNRPKYKPNSFSELLKLISTRAQNNELLVSVGLRERGVWMKGGALTSLPPSVSSVVLAPGTSGRYGQMRENVIFQDRVRTKYHIKGLRTVTLRVRNNVANYKRKSNK